MRLHRFPPIRGIDIFALINLALFLILCIFRYYARFIHYRGAGNINEFFIYAIAIIAAIGALWFIFRRFAVAPMVFILLQIGILMHFAGAFVRIDDHRLYDFTWGGIRYDKYVHFVNAFVVSVLLRRLFISPRNNHHRLINGIFILLAVLGLGAVVEIVEYGVCKTVPANGVGDYDNNMQDLMANWVGGTFFLLLCSLPALPAWFNRIIAPDKVKPTGEPGEA